MTKIKNRKTKAKGFSKISVLVFKVIVET